MGGKLVNKKKAKLDNLYNAAYDLLTSNGVRNAIVDDIVKKAGVAKGTFYLYFKDKDDLVDKVIIRKTSSLLNEALAELAATGKFEPRDFQQSVIFITNYLMNFFTVDKQFLELIHGNLSLPLFQRLVSCEELAYVRDTFIQNYIHAGGTAESAHHKLFIIINLVCSVCYNVIALEFPCKFEDIKQDLYDSINKILTF